MPAKGDKIPLPDRLAAYHVKIGECWIWNGKIDRRKGQGYGSIQVEGRTRLVHRVAWETFVGEIPQGKCVLHRCDVKLCINPRHLYIGTHKDNTQDAIERGLWNPHDTNQPVGEANPAAVLTEEKVRAIRTAHASGISIRKLGPMFGCGYTTAWFVVHRRMWRHVQ